MKYMGEGGKELGAFLSSLPYSDTVLNPPRFSRIAVLQLLLLLNHLGS